MRQHPGPRHAAPTSKPVALLSTVSSYGSALAGSLVTAALTAAALLFLAAAYAILSLHVSSQVVLTGSMRGTFDPGAVVFSRPVPVDSIKPGDVIVFTPPGHDVPYTHRVVTVTGPANKRVVTTKGDANRAPDAWKAQLKGSTVPRVFAHAPYAGRALLAVKGRYAHSALLGLLGVIVAISGARFLMNSAPKPRARTALPA
ncbi:MAG: signal peptidase [Frankiales bacterium]|nr:signal peptidase [Frankiales bacterium]